MPFSQNSLEQASDVPKLAEPNREMAWQVASNLLASFQFAWNGVTYALRTQRNFRIHVVVGTLAISLGLWLQLNTTSIAILSLTSGAVLTMELINTAIESVVDLTVQQAYHELAKIAKDCAAAAVLISALASVLVAGCLLVPPLFARFQLSFS
ncbi:MAG: diacylglycerol kinase family protein [Leptolyngbyaceae cyanobacterium SM1_1_3]|nr:diacylglycerol kinase family protein [Leptolyngbyaceae cyanobacterium SM1_1_3]NJN03719.1 diacylglycerol kinase family protein [Leptolyngbyaceae cyanobacterium RM1_1_2]NJO09347.1 diacylglycerol kinase family protein [Leptolyngbyaceae cyanobacterium SL_1_1]